MDYKRYARESDKNGTWCFALNSIQVIAKEACLALRATNATEFRWSVYLLATQFLSLESFLCIYTP